MIFELQIYKRVELDPRFVERLLKLKVSDLCVFSLARMPSGQIVVDANKRATILETENFETVM